MGLYSLNLDELASYTGIMVEELKKKSYADLEAMINRMREDKIIERNRRNANDIEYERLVLKFFEPLSLLRHWFSDEEIVLACAQTGVTKENLCEEMCVKPGAKCWRSNNEFLRTSVESVPQFDSHGNELMNRKRERCDVYRVMNRYQSVHNAKPILYLLYERYPELGQFEFAAYGMHSYDENYEIYPKNHIYVPFGALLSGDIDMIIHRNMEYCRWYNNGCYTVEECDKTLRSEEGKKMLDMIYMIGQKEWELGHSPMWANENDQWHDVAGLTQTRISYTGNMKLLQAEERVHDVQYKCIFKLKTEKSCTLRSFIAEFLDMMKDIKSVEINICHVTDYLGDHAVTITVNNPNRFCVDSLPINEVNVGEYAGGEPIDCSDYPVLRAFGWTCHNKCSLTLRIDCPALLHM